VWKVRDKKSSSVYAMKEMLKTKIILKKSIESVMNENSLLRKLSHPFLVNMSYAFQDR
jgi:protein kinase A